MAQQPSTLMMKRPQAEFTLPDGVQVPLSEADYEDLKRTVNPLADSNDFGVDLFIATVESLASHLLEYPNS